MCARTLPRAPRARDQARNVSLRRNRAGAGLLVSRGFLPSAVRLLPGDPRPRTRQPLPPAAAPGRPRAAADPPAPRSRPSPLQGPPKLAIGAPALPPPPNLEDGEIDEDGDLTPDARRSEAPTPRRGLRSWEIAERAPAPPPRSPERPRKRRRRRALSSADDGVVVVIGDDSGGTSSDDDLHRARSL